MLIKYRKKQKKKGLNTTICLILNQSSSLLIPAKTSSSAPSTLIFNKSIFSILYFAISFDIDVVLTLTKKKIV